MKDNKQGYEMDYEKKNGVRKKLVKEDKEKEGVEKARIEGRGQRRTSKRK